MPGDVGGKAREGLPIPIFCCGVLIEFASNKMLGIEGKSTIESVLHRDQEESDV